MATPNEVAYVLRVATSGECARATISPGLHVVATGPGTAMNDLSCAICERDVLGVRCIALTLHVGNRVRE